MLVKVTYINRKTKEYERYYIATLEETKEHIRDIGNGMYVVSVIIQRLKDVGIVRFHNSKSVIHNIEYNESGYNEESYHFHDSDLPCLFGHGTKEYVNTKDEGCPPECFTILDSDVYSNLDAESEDFREWILSNPDVGDAFIGEGNAVRIVRRVV